MWVWNPIQNYVRFERVRAGLKMNIRGWRWILIDHFRRTSMSTITWTETSNSWTIFWIKLFVSHFLFSNSSIVLRFFFTFFLKSSLSLCELIFEHSHTKFDEICKFWNFDENLYSLSLSLSLCEISLPLRTLSDWFSNLGFWVKQWLSGGGGIRYFVA